MVGAGERMEEIREVIRDLVNVGCQALTLGQYLQPSASHHPVERYVTPEEFQGLKELALAEGMSHVVAGPLVRSSYRAADWIDHLNDNVQ